MVHPEELQSGGSLSLHMNGTVASSSSTWLHWLRGGVASERIPAANIKSAISRAECERRWYATFVSSARLLDVRNRPSGSFQPPAGTRLPRTRNLAKSLGLATDHRTADVDTLTSSLRLLSSLCRCETVTFGWKRPTSCQAPAGQLCAAARTCLSGN